MGTITFSSVIQATKYGLCLGFVNQLVPYRGHIWYDPSQNN